MTKVSLRLLVYGAGVKTKSTQNSYWLLRMNWVPLTRFTPGFTEYKIAFAVGPRAKI
jgi:hypothetical protein